MSEASATPAHKVYNIAHWSDGYIGVNDKGQVLIRPDRGHSPARINLPELTRTLTESGVQLPVLVRFVDILHDRVNKLCNAFNKVAEEHAYQGGYTAVYPIKVNQQRRVVEELLAAEPAASNGQIGLEAGSKPELMAVLAMSQQPGSVIVCNGYKDREYIRLALIGQTLGHRVFIVVEKKSELPLILEEAKSLGVSPLIGVRARLATIGKGNWQNTGGEKSKFGLSASQVLDVVDTLREAGALDTLQLLHFHLGSQIANIRDIQTGLRECARFYSELRQMGAPIGTVDIGGGLGVDYEGTRSRSSCSMNYSVYEYAYNVVHVLQAECDRHGTPHPDLISESGRALTAHHSVLVTNVIDHEAPENRTPHQPGATASAPLHDLWRDLESLQDTNTPAHWLRSTMTYSTPWPMFTPSSPTAFCRSRSGRMLKLCTPAAADCSGISWTAATELTGKLSTNSMRNWRKNSSLIFPCSSHCPMSGALIRSSRLCRSTAWIAP